MLQAGIVDEDVDAAEFGFHPREHLAHLALVRDVGAIGVGPVVAAAPDLFDDRLCLVFVADIVDDDVGAGMAEADRDAAADAGRGAGHQRLLSLELSLDRTGRHHHRRQRRVVDRRNECLIHRLRSPGGVRNGVGGVNSTAHRVSHRAVEAK